jgi:hypothetical protein
MQNVPTRVVPTPHYPIPRAKRPRMMVAKSTDKTIEWTPVSAGAMTSLFGGSSSSSPDHAVDQAGQSMLGSAATVIDASQEPGPELEDPEFKLTQEVEKELEEILDLSNPAAELSQDAQQVHHVN